ncbi:DNA damage-inducible protein DinB [Candidatus Nanopelagicaceae bacterium]
MDAAKLLKHMAWANQEIFSKVAELPDEALDAYAVNPEWTAREIMRHIASSATYYGYRLIDKDALSEAEKTEWQVKLEATHVPPVTMRDMNVILDRIAAADAELLRAASEPEGFVIHTMDGRTVSRARSTIISQSIHHATEHRAQLISALEAKGFVGINLDDFDLWYYADTIGE